MKKAKMAAKKACIKKSDANPSTTVTKYGLWFTIVYKLFMKASVS